MKARHFLDVSELKSLGATIAYAFEQLELANVENVRLQAALLGVKEGVETLKERSEESEKA